VEKIRSLTIAVPFGCGSYSKVKMLRRAFLFVWALALLLTLVGCYKQTSTQASIDPLLEKLVSDDAKVLVAFDLTALKTTAFYARHQTQLDTPLLNDLSGRIGFDPRHDISKLLLAWNGKELLLSARGHFDKRQIEMHLADSSKPTEYKGYALFGEGRETVVFLDSQLAIASSMQAVRNAIDVYKENTGHLPEEFSSDLAQLSGAEPIWLVSRGGLPFADMPTRTDMASILSNFAGYVRSTSAGIAVDEGLQLKARIDCISLQGSKRMDDGLRGGIGLARLAARDKQPDLVQLYDAIRVRKDEQTVYVNADLPAALADDLLRRLAGLKLK
jgi:hypothetical protein